MNGNSNKQTFEQLGSSLDAFFSKIETRVNDTIPPVNTVKSTIFNTPARIKSDLAINLAETDTTFIITCDIPGIEKSQIQVKLLSQTSLNIKINVDKNKIEEENVTYILKERKDEPRERTIILPSSVSPEDAKATFNNGVMEIILTKAQKEEATEISIE